MSAKVYALTIDSVFSKNVYAFLDTHCLECHDSIARRGDIDLEHFMDEPRDDLELFHRVRTVLELDQMPPPERERPSASDIASFLERFHKSKEALAIQLGSGDRRRLRRVSHSEYTRSLRDLLGVEVDTDTWLLPENAGGEGFTNVSASQFIQGASLERYVRVAEMLADQTFVLPGSGLNHWSEQTDHSYSAIRARSRSQLKEFAETLIAGWVPKDFASLNISESIYTLWFNRNSPGDVLEDPYLKNWLRFLNTESPESRFLDFPREEWARIVELSDPEAVRLGAQAIENHVKAWVEPYIGLAPSFRQLEAETGRGQRFLEIIAETDTFYLNVTSAGDGNRGDTVIWEEIQFTHNLNAFAQEPYGPWSDYLEWLDAEIDRLSRENHDTVGSKKTQRLKQLEAARANLMAVQVDNGFRMTAPSALALPVPDGAIYGRWVGRAVEPEPSDLQHASVQYFPSLEAVVDLNALIPGKTIVSVKGSAIHQILKREMQRFRSVFLGGETARVKSQVRALASVRDAVHIPRESFEDKQTVRAQLLESEVALEDTLGAIERVRGERPSNVFELRNLYQYFSDKGMSEREAAVALFDWVLSENLNAEASPIYRLSLRDVFKRTGLQDQALLEKLRKDWSFMKIQENVLNDAWFTQWHAVLLIHIEDFAERAWRRELSEPDRENLRGFYFENVLDADSYQGAAQACIAYILSSPNFLYWLDDPSERKAGRVLADRLSAFLWSSLPSERMVFSPNLGELLDIQEYRKTVLEMLEDGRSRSLAEVFGGQWLGYYKLDTRIQKMGSADLLREEAIEFVDRLIRENRPVAELFAADYVYWNDALAAYYGELYVSDKDGWQQIPSETRGGIASMGISLIQGSYSHRSSPVLRGVWILDRLLGSPPRPPPPEVPVFPEGRDFDSLAVSERLKLHSDNPNCVSCHKDIDPLGLALEGFDEFGRRRENIDPENLASHWGNRAIADYSGLKAIFQEQEKMLVRQLTRKLLAFALGRELSLADEVWVDSVAEEEELHFQDLILKIVESSMFLEGLPMHGSKLGYQN